MCNAPVAALTSGLSWPWSLSVALMATAPVVAVGSVAVVVLVGKLTSRHDRRRFLTLVCQRVGRWFS